MATSTTTRKFSPEHEAQLREIREAVSLGYQLPRGATFSEELRGARAFTKRHCAKLRLT